ncbi:MAG: hypothetical protein HYX68_23290 [Planctomycetes bacterium]|nr:hypothetical protein [Planctomycetota bacterium]
MIELSRDQLQVIAREADKPTVVIDPSTGQKFRLIKEDIYDLMKGLAKPLNQNWDNPEDDDLIRKDL